MQRSFYYFKTVFQPSDKEKKALEKLEAKNLYVKFFDVSWNETNHSAEPIAKAIFQQPPSADISITPVVFITQEPLQKLDSADLAVLAVNITKLVSDIAANNKLPLSNEIQIDCDWTANTKNKYFYLLEQLKKQAFFQSKIFSATIRLHQLKFVSQNGIPPVNKGLLMCYNMGNLRYPQTKNSIIDEEELVKYTNTLYHYKLPLDVALPIFDWWVLFDKNEYKGLVREFGGIKNLRGNQIHFQNDTIINGIAFKSGQWLRHETSDADVIRNCAEHISRKLKTKELTVILYHLDEDHLSKYSQNELESFFDSFR